MEINLINLDDFNGKINTYTEDVIQTVNVDLDIQNDLQSSAHDISKSILLEDLIKNIKKNSIINNTSNNKLDIIFENFSTYRAVLFNIKNFFKKEQAEDAFYNKKDKMIHITKELLEKSSQIQSTYTEHLLRKITLQDFINVVVLHEMGHAFNHARILETGKNLTESSKTNVFFNKTVLINQYPNIPQLDNLDYLNPSRNIYLATSEGFADLYCAIALTQLYPQEKAMNLIEAIIESRKKADENNRECYQTQGMLKQFFHEFKHNDSKIQFKDFAQVYDYMSAIIGEQALITLSTSLKNTGKVEQTFNSQYLGFINGSLDLKSATPQETIKKLNNDYGFNLPVTTNYNQDLFTHWTAQGENHQQNNLKKTGNKMRIEASIIQLRENSLMNEDRKITFKA